LKPGSHEFGNLIPFYDNARCLGVRYFITVVTGVSLLEKEVNRAITKVTITIGDSNVCVPFI